MVIRAQVGVVLHRQRDLAVASQILGTLRVNAVAGQHRDELSPQSVEVEHFAAVVFVRNAGVLDEILPRDAFQGIGVSDEYAVY
jgi:hypothetical protein